MPVTRRSETISVLRLGRSIVEASPRRSFACPLSSSALKWAYVTDATSSSGLRQMETGLFVCSDTDRCGPATVHNRRQVAPPSAQGEAAAAGILQPVHRTGFPP